MSEDLDRAGVTRDNLNSGTPQGKRAYRYGKAVKRALDRLNARVR
jgi:hypothetical protein